MNPKDIENLIAETDFRNQLKVEKLVLDNAIPSFDSSKNWKEDYEHENGNYLNKCTKCDEYFYGHKRRFMCKECFKLPPNLSNKIF